MKLLFAFLIGFFAGLRSLMAPATTAWAVHLGWLKIQRPFSLIGAVPSVGIFTVLAVIELIADKLPQTPSRTSPLGLIARIVTGGLTGACVVDSGLQGVLLGAVLGAIGGVGVVLLGAVDLGIKVQILGETPSRPAVALSYDLLDVFAGATGGAGLVLAGSGGAAGGLVAVGGCLWVVSRF